MLSGDPPNPIYERTFLIFNTTLFGVTATPRADFILDTGDYNDELREFNEQLAAERTQDAATTDSLPLPPLPSAPSSPPESHVSVSVTSNISHVTAAVNIVTSNITLVPADEEVEAPPLATKTAKVPTRKKAARGPAKPPGASTEIVTPVIKRNPTRRAKNTPVEPSTKPTRSRS